MKKELIWYFLILLVPICGLPFAGQRLLDGEAARGRSLGRAYLQVVAENFALSRQAGETAADWLARLPPNLQAGVVDASGAVVEGAALPTDGRCCGEVPLAADGSAGGRILRVTWAGAVDPGRARMQRFVRSATLLYALAASFVLLGGGLIGLSAVRARREMRRRLDDVADFSHRLKTPLTAISVCAELAETGRLDEKGRVESAETVMSEARKLGGIVDEVLAYVKEARRG